MEQVIPLGRVAVCRQKPQVHGPVSPDLKQQSECLLFYLTAAQTFLGAP